MVAKLFAKIGRSAIGLYWSAIGLRSVCGWSYKLHCGCCGDFYVGKTQKYGKHRAQQHINSIVKMWKKNNTTC